MKAIIGTLMFVLLIGTTVFGDDGAPMVLVPAGEFIMGPPGAEKTVYLKSYYIDKYEVTVDRFRKFVKETGHVTTAERLGYTVDSEGKYYGYNWKNADKQPPYKTYGDNYPVTCVSPEDAEAYAKWAGKRIPTEAEWEKAARGTDGRKYPWGNNIPSKKKMANIARDYIQPVAVGSYPEGASPYGCLDIVGNLWEYARKEGQFGRYCQRGGAWNSFPDYVKERNPKQKPVVVEDITVYFTRGNFGPSNFTSKHCTTIRCVKDGE